MYALGGSYARGVCHTHSIHFLPPIEINIVMYMYMYKSYTCINTDKRVKLFSEGTLYMYSSTHSPYCQKRSWSGLRLWLLSLVDQEERERSCRNYWRKEQRRKTVGYGPVIVRVLHVLVLVAGLKVVGPNHTPLASFIFKSIPVSMLHAEKLGRACGQGCQSPSL